MQTANNHDEMLKFTRNLEYYELNNKTLFSVHFVGKLKIENIQY